MLADVSTKPLGALSDGTFVLYDTGFQAPEQPATEEFPIRPVLYGAGGLAVVAWPPAAVAAAVIPPAPPTWATCRWR